VNYTLILIILLFFNYFTIPAVHTEHNQNQGHLPPAPKEQEINMLKLHKDTQGSRLALTSWYLCTRLKQFYSLLFNTMHESLVPMTVTQILYNIQIPM